MAGNLDVVLPRKFALRGALINTQAGLALKFQFNPTSLGWTKGVTYNVREIPGLDHPDVTFVSGGVKRVKFDQWFDRTQGAVDSRVAAVGIPLVGTEAVKAVVESFLYPQAPRFSPRARVQRFTEPPKAMLTLGPKLYETKMEGDQELRDALLDATLTPVRLFAALSFIVLEEGSINDVNVMMRRSLAVSAATIAVLDTATEIGDVAGVFE